MAALIRWLALLALVGFAAFWYATRPAPLAPEIAELLPSGDAEAGRLVFHTAGCASCHVPPETDKASDTPILTGGQRFPSDFGTFLAPNISQDETHGLGSWSDAEIARAITEGVSPEGRHYYPAFPYSAYTKAAPRDIADLVAFLRTLPADATPSQAHEVGFPFNIRRSLGGWKFLFMSEDWVIAGSLSPEAARGRYLAEALGHCGECHTRRNVIGGLTTSTWMAGAPIPGSEKGRTPNVTPAKLKWSEADIAEYLNSGFTPEFDTAGGHMVPVVRNFAMLPAEDRAAVAAYLKALPAVE